jgi:hypothetical protein
MSQNISLGSYVVRALNGSVDIESTVAKFQTDLEKFAALQEADEAAIASAVAAVFDEHPNTNLNLPAVASLAFNKMGLGAASYTEMVERIQDHVRNAKTLYVIKKGKGGGCSRVKAEATTETPAS